MLGGPLGSPKGTFPDTPGCLGAGGVGRGYDSKMSLSSAGTPNSPGGLRQSRPGMLRSESLHSRGDPKANFWRKPKKCLCVLARKDVQPWEEMFVANGLEKEAQ